MATNNKEGNNRDQFIIYLNDQLIGSTALEKANVPMGVVFGKMHLLNIDNAYTFFKSYCLSKQIGITVGKKDQILSTRHIHNLKVVDMEGDEIKGEAVSVAGQGAADFEITIEGVPHNIYTFKFKHHIEHYNKLFDQHFEKDNIIEIGIDDQERLYIKPEKATFPMIYRTATEVHWNDNLKVLYSPKPKERSYLDWYKQIIAVVQTECYYILQITSDTIWINISSELKSKLINI